MSLLRLLATGKSLVGMPDTTSRYRMRTQNLLPKFISPKNPFAPAPPKSEPAGPSKPVSGPAKPAPAKLETGSLFGGERKKPAVARETKASVPRKYEPVKTEMKAEAVARPVASPIPAPVKPAQKPGRWFDWVKNLNPASFFSGGFRSGGMASRGRAGGKQVQAELSLDRVQVVRNDLHDADLEIVPGRLMGLPSGASPVLAGTIRPEPGGWGRLASRYLGVEQTQI